MRKRGPAEGMVARGLCRTAAALLALLAVGALLLWQGRNRAAREEAGRARDAALCRAAEALAGRAGELAELHISLPEPPGEERKIDFALLWQTNPDTVAWLEIPGTGIDHPVVWNGSNSTYLTMAFDGSYSRNGTVFLDFESSPAFEGRHHIIYGHNWQNGEMFDPLTRFSEQSFYEAHREILLYTPEETIRLRTVACLDGPARAENRRTRFADEDAFYRYLEQMTEGCAFRTLPDRAPEAFTFITCNYAGRDWRTYLWSVREELFTGAEKGRNG